MVRTKKNAPDYSKLYAYNFDVENANNTDWNNIRWGHLHIQTTKYNYHESFQAHFIPLTVYENVDEFVGDWSAWYMSGITGTYPEVYGYKKRPMTLWEVHKLLEEPGHFIKLMVENVLDMFERGGLDAVMISMGIDMKLFLKAVNRCRKKFYGRINYDFSALCETVTMILAVFNIPAVLTIEEYTENNENGVMFGRLMGTSQLREFKNAPIHGGRCLDSFWYRCGLEYENGKLIGWRK